MNWRIPTLIAGLLLVSGCSWFGGDDDAEEIKEPTPLTSINREVKLVSLWDHKVGRGIDKKALKIVPGVSDTRVFAATPDGNVVALQASDGREIWEVNVLALYDRETRLTGFSEDVDVITGGVGVGAQLAIVATAAGELIALNQSDGSLAWRAKTSSEVLSQPQVDGDLVVAQSVDGKVAAFNAINGQRRWIYSTQIPSLTLRGTSTPFIGPDFVIAAFANGRVVVLDRERGIAGADERVASATGRSDLERLVDIDGEMVFAGSTLYAVGFQGRIIALDLVNNRISWAEEASSIAGLGQGFGNIYIAHEDDRLGAIDMNSGREVWEVSALRYRDITTPVAVSSFLAVGDYDGYLHVLAQSDGRFVGRRRIDGDGLLAPAVADGIRLYVMGNSGRLSALEIQ